MSVRTVFILCIVLFSWGCSPSRGVYHTVVEGQTLYRISHAYGVDELYLARINGIADPTRLHPGDLIFIPGAKQALAVRGITSNRAVTPDQISPTRIPASKQLSAGLKSAPASPKLPPDATPQQAPSLPAGTAAPPLVAAPPVPTPPKVVTAQAAPISKEKFLWPVRGPILRRFGKEGATPCKGLEIAVAARTPVVSAAAGRVIYSGDGIRSYGNLVILKHDQSFFTVYGYNDSNLVQAGSFVGKGEKIALSGTSPGGGQPRLYFEIRYGKEAVNPSFYLP